jgi:hypothetical protein
MMLIMIRGARRSLDTDEAALILPFRYWNASSALASGEVAPSRHLSEGTAFSTTRGTILEQLPFRHT